MADVVVRMRPNVRTTVPIPYTVFGKTLPLIYKAGMDSHSVHTHSPSPMDLSVIFSGQS